eukprot:14785477-Alexandrium_andersonii.AAC.1
MCIRDSSCPGTGGLVVSIYWRLGAALSVPALVAWVHPHWSICGPPTAAAGAAGCSPSSRGASSE